MTIDCRINSRRGNREPKTVALLVMFTRQLKKNGFFDIPVEAGMTKPKSGATRLGKRFWIGEEIVHHTGETVGITIRIKPHGAARQRCEGAVRRYVRHHRGNSRQQIGKMLVA